MSRDFISPSPARSRLSTEILLVSCSSGCTNRLKETTKLEGLIRESESFTEAAKKFNEMMSWFFLPFLRFLGSFEEPDLLN